MLLARLDLPEACAGNLTGSSAAIVGRLCLSRRSQKTKAGQTLIYLAKCKSAS
jgi:hypothetical protein